MTKIIRQFNIFLKSSYSLESRNNLFKLIWDIYHPKIMLFIRSMIKNKPGGVEDIAQDVMLKVYNNLHKYNPFYSFDTWIYSIARNHCIDNLKKKNIIDNKFSDLLDIVNFNHANNYAPPDNIVISDEINNCIESYLKTLSDKDRQISFLRFYEKLEYRKISKIMNIPVGTIKYRVHLTR